MSDSTKVAIIGAVAALIGAVVGVFGASIPAYIQANATRQIEADKFYREQRYPIYEDYYNALQDFTETAEFRQMADDGVELTQPQKDALNRNLRKVSEIGGKLDFVAPQSVLDARSQITDARNTLTSGVTYPDDLLDRTNRFDAAVSNFLGKAREDLDPR